VRRAAADRKLIHMYISFMKEFKSGLRSEASVVKQTDGDSGLYNEESGIRKILRVLIIESVIGTYCALSAETFHND
jgi:hypothetical protein